MLRLHRIDRRTLAVVLFALLCVSQLAAGVTVEKVLVDYTRAVGGLDAISAIESRQFMGHAVHDLSWQSPTYSVFDLVIVCSTPDSAHIREYDSEELRKASCQHSGGWTSRATVEHIVDEADTDNKVMWILQPQLPLYLAFMLGPLTYSGTQVVGGHTCHVLTPENYPAEQYSLYFNANTGLLLRVGYYITLHDYTEIDGIMTPTRIVDSRKGGSITYVFKKVCSNIDVDSTMLHQVGPGL